MRKYESGSYLQQEKYRLEEVSVWLYKVWCAKYNQCTILGFKVFEYKQVDNILEIDFEWYALETKDITKHGLFQMVEDPLTREYFPYGIFYSEHNKINCTFKSKAECDELAENSSIERLRGSETYFDWSDSRLPDKLIADLFDYRCPDSIGLKIIKKFNLLDINSKIPEYLPSRLIPHVEKSVATYRDYLQQIINHG